MRLENTFSRRMGVEKSDREFGGIRDFLILFHR